MCFESRKKPALIVTILSTIIILAGLVMVVESIVFASGANVLDADLGQVTEQAHKFKSLSYGSLLAFSFLAIITGIAGTTCGCKPCRGGNICWPIMFGISLFFVWLITLIIGSIITGVSMSGPEQIQKFCDESQPWYNNTSNQTTNTDGYTWVQQSIWYIDQGLNGYSSHYMCSSECPCDDVKARPWTDMQETELNRFNRTLTQRSGTGSNSNVLKDSRGNIRLITTSTGEKYKNFTECNDILQKRYGDDDSNYTNPNNIEVPYGPAMSTSISIISYFEAKYTCSGICTTSLFYTSLDLEKGVPSTTCLTYLKTEIGDSMQYLGVTAVVAGLIMFLIWIAQYALWRKYEDEQHFDNRN